MHIDLRKRDDDIVFGEEFGDAEPNFALECRAVGREVVPNPESNIKEQRAVAEIEKIGGGLGPLEGAAQPLGGFDKEGLHLAHVGSIGDTDRNMHADLWILMRPVDDVAFQEGGVRHDDMEIVCCADAGAAQAD